MLFVIQPFLATQPPPDPEPATTLILTSVSTFALSLTPVTPVTEGSLVLTPRE